MKKNKFKNFKSKAAKSYNNKNFNSEDKINIGNITLAHSNQTFILFGIIDKIFQTPGPTIFYINDGTGVLALKSFQGPGIRAHSEIKEGDIVKVIVKIEEFRDEIEGDIINISVVKEDKKNLILKEIEKIERERISIKPINFLISNDILEKLKPFFIKAATEIRLAIMKNRPIIIRHHNDTDGYSAGFALEKAILPLIERQHLSIKAAWEFYTRAPCAAPFYEIDDSIRDTANSLRNVAKFSNKMPLIIIVDNGSSPEDLLAIKQGKIHGADFIVIDHHFFDKDMITEEVLVHINPFLVKEDGAKFSAGMLCVEVARFINPEVKNIEQIAAMAGFADRVDLTNPEAVNLYLKIAEKNGYTKELLEEISRVIDFVSSKVKFMEAREYIEVIFGEPRNKQKALIELLAPHIKHLELKGLEIAKSCIKIEKINKISLQYLDIEETFPRFGFYPKPGKVIGMIHDYAKEIKKIDALISIGMMDAAIILRATDGANFSIHELIDFIEKKLPIAFVNGGGHKNAGSISFVPHKKNEVLKLLKEFIKSR
ncbi:MAG: hypothetical protein QW727_00235 [Candidatus Pacearchaeota archaeon]